MCNAIWLNRAIFRIPLIFNSLQIICTLTRCKPDGSLVFYFGIVCDKHHGISYLYISFVGCRKHRKATNCWERDASQNLVDRRQYRVTSVLYWISLGLRRLDLFLKKSKTHFGRYIFYIFTFLPTAFTCRLYFVSYDRERESRGSFSKDVDDDFDYYFFFFTRYYEEGREDKCVGKEKTARVKRNEKS